MKNNYRLSLYLVFCATAAVACGQEDLEWPDAGAAAASGECGAWYPSSGASDEEAEDAYAVEEGKIFPCAVWESAKLNNVDTYVNLGEEYLKAKHGVANKRAVVIIISAQDCTNCEELIGAVKDRVQEFEDAGAFMLGAAYTSSSDSTVTLDLNEAAMVLYGDDKWPKEAWPITNDQEGYIKGLGVFPQLIVVRMSDMTVHTIGTGAFGTDNKYDSADDLLATIESFPAVAEPAEE